MSLISDAEDYLKQAEDALLNDRSMTPETRKKMALLTFEVRGLLKIYEGRERK